MGVAARKTVETPDAQAPRRPWQVVGSDHALATIDSPARGLQQMLETAFTEEAEPVVLKYHPAVRLTILSGSTFGLWTIIIIGVRMALRVI